MEQPKQQAERCPDKNLLRAYCERTLFGSANVSVLEHIKYCSPCLRQLASLQLQAKIAKPVEKTAPVRYPSLVA